MTPPSEQASGVHDPVELCLSPPVADQFAYHVRMTAVFAVAGQTEQSASEAVLAWAILMSQWPGAETSAADCACRRRRSISSTPCPRDR